MAKLISNKKYDKLYLNTELSLKNIFDEFFDYEDYNDITTFHIKETLFEGCYTGYDFMFLSLVDDAEYNTYLSIIVQVGIVLICDQLNYDTGAANTCYYVGIHPAMLTEEYAEQVDTILASFGRTRETLGWLVGFNGVVTVNMPDEAVTLLAFCAEPGDEWPVEFVFLTDNLVSDEEHVERKAVQLTDGDVYLVPITKTSLLIDDAGWTNRISALENVIANFEDADTMRF